MDKITHQIRAEHWTKILNECINSGMSKTAWCRANGISEKQFFYWQRILRREAFEHPLTSFISPECGSGFPSGSRDPKRRAYPGNIEFCFRGTSFPDRRDSEC